MTGRLGIQEFMVLKTSGLPVFHYSPIGTRKVDDLLSGFLTAITSFASEFGESSVRSLSFEGSEILYEPAGDDLLFILLVETGAPSKVLRAVLRDLSNRFLVRYTAEIAKPIVQEKDFHEFKQEARKSFDYYEGIVTVISSLSSYVVPKLNKEAYEQVSTIHGFLDEMHRDFGRARNQVLQSIDGTMPIAEISLKTGLDHETITEIIEYLAIWGVVEIFKMCPQIKSSDDRFDTYLDIIGLPRREFRILNDAKSYCDGRTPLPVISKTTGASIEELYGVLKKMGDEIRWNLRVIQVERRPIFVG